MDTDASAQHWAYTLHVPHDARAIGIARATLHAVLVRNSLPQLLDTAVLLASELLTNAYLHSAGPASLRLRWCERRLRLGVWDTDPHPPAGDGTSPGGTSAAGSDTEQPSGRGLLLVRVCADAWGWFPLGDEHSGLRGKYVWCELAHPADPQLWDIAA